VDFDSANISRNISRGMEWPGVWAADEHRAARTDATNEERKKNRMTERCGDRKMQTTKQEMATDKRG
jgi:hypothetical protein